MVVSYVSEMLKWVPISFFYFVGYFVFSLAQRKSSAEFQVSSTDHRRLRTVCSSFYNRHQCVNVQRLRYTADITVHHWI